MQTKALSEKTALCLKTLSHAGEECPCVGVRACACVFMRVCLRVYHQCVWAGRSRDVWLKSRELRPAVGKD